MVILGKCVKKQDIVSMLMSLDLVFMSYYQVFLLAIPSLSCTVSF